MEKQYLNSTNSESASVTNKSSPIDIVIRILEVISLVLMLVPYFLIGASMSSIPGKDYFFLFADGLISILPTGIFALIIQLIRKLRKQSASTLSKIVLISSIVTSIFGVLAIMLIYAVAS